ncbi:hypothetical protein ACFX2B_028409 [Malus domestica]
MPFVNKVREIEGTTLYGSRTLFFLTEDGTLRPVAIELTRPPVGDGNKHSPQLGMQPVGGCGGSLKPMFVLMMLAIISLSTGLGLIVARSRIELQLIDN